MFQHRSLSAGRVYIFKKDNLWTFNLLYWKIYSPKNRVLLKSASTIILPTWGISYFWKRQFIQERALLHSTILHSTLHSTLLSFLIGLLVFCVSCHLTAIIPEKSIFVSFCFDRFNKFYFVCFLFIIIVLRKGQSKGQNWVNLIQYTCNIIKIAR